MVAEIMMMMVKEKVKEEKDRFYLKDYMSCRFYPAAFLLLHPVL